MHPALIMQQLTDKEGLDKAYAQAEQLYVHGDTMYVAGTSYLQDVWDDLTIPWPRGMKTRMLYLVRILRLLVWWGIFSEVLRLITEEPRRTNIQGQYIRFAAMLCRSGLLIQNPIQKCSKFEFQRGTPYKWFWLQ